MELETQPDNNNYFIFHRDNDKNLSKKIVSANCGYSKLA